MSCAGLLDEPKAHDSSADRHCVIHVHHDKSLVACILLLYCVYGAQSRDHGLIQPSFTTHAPVLMSCAGLLDEPKAHDSSADRHCVIHMHHDKSLVACILLLHCVYGAQSWDYGSIQPSLTTHAPVLMSCAGLLDEPKAHDSSADRHCVCVFFLISTFTPISYCSGVLLSRYFFEVFIVGSVCACRRPVISYVFHNYFKNFLCIYSITGRRQGSWIDRTKSNHK